jgi:formylglycine-generating enzyme required for sulfatase activity
MIRVDGRSFDMGAERSDGPDVRENEGYRHRVVLRPYYLSETELPWKVVVAYWRRFPDRRPPQSEVQPDDDLNLPAHSLTFREWTQVLNWLSQESGRAEYYDADGQGPSESDRRRFGPGLRLPTEAELERVLREDPDPSDRLPDLVGVDEAATGHGGFQGLRGNVWELTGDWLGPYDPDNRKVVNDPCGPPTGKEKVIRGGSKNSASRLARASARYGLKPSVRAPDVGVRVATYGP